MATRPARPRRRTAPRAARGGRRQRNRERTRRAILQAALGLFSRKGFFRTPTKEISRRAGIAEGTLFNYFRTKEDLALYFFEEEVAALMDWYRKDPRLRRATLPEQLFAVLHHHLRRMEPYQDFIGAVYLRALEPLSRLSPLSLDSQEINLRYLRFIRGILEEAERRQEIPRVGDIGAYVFVLFHLAVITYWLHDRSRKKENTLALLDRSLTLATSFIGKKRGWQW
jgi:TetR/AcrR family transcriptional regulator, fatty acid metabolism regulator protein